MKSGRISEKIKIFRKRLWLASLLLCTKKWLIKTKELSLFSAIPHLIKHVIQFMDHRPLDTNLCIAPIMHALMHADTTNVSHMGINDQYLSMIPEKP